MHHCIVHVKNWERSEGDLYSVPAEGITIHPGGSRSVSWACRMVVACQIANRTEPE